MVFALVGNQNCGKTTLFNALTGSNQHVGNFPGVTVDQKMGEIRDEKGCSVVDLPGIYSLRPYTQEEIVSRDFIINQKPDGIINIVDATNIERNLYLTLQLLELRVPMVLALNMMDEVRANGGSIDVRKMSQALGIPVIPITAAKGEGVSELVDQALTVARGKVLPKVTDFCSDDSAVHRCIHAVVHLIADHADRIGVPARFCAAKLIEGGDDLENPRTHVAMIIALFASVVVNLAILLSIVLIGDGLISILPASVLAAFNFVMPCLLANNILMQSKGPDGTIIKGFLKVLPYLLTGVAAQLLVKNVFTFLSNYGILLAVVLSVLVAYGFYRRDLAAHEKQNS